MAKNNYIYIPRGILNISYGNTENVVIQKNGVIRLNESIRKKNDSLIPKIKNN